MNFTPRPPSRFHEEARNRDAGHDAMQAEFMDYLRRRPIWNPKGVIIYREVEAECPLHRRGQIVSYVDAVEILTVNLTTIVSLFELKPRIDTVYGIVRQAKAILALAEDDIPGDQHHCHVVVKAADPLLATLRKEWPHVWAWGVGRFDGALIGAADVSD